MKKRIDTKYFIPEDLDKGSIVVSGGGYIGEWDYYIYETYGCYLYSFEPFPDNYKKLIELFPPKFCRKVAVMQKALWDRDGHKILYLVDGKSSGHSLFDRTERGKKVVGSVKIPTIRLDTFMKRSRILKIHLLKLNIEGAEVQVLQSIDKHLAKRILNICFLLMNDPLLRMMIR